MCEEARCRANEHTVFSEAIFFTPSWILASSSHEKCDFLYLNTSTRPSALNKKLTVEHIQEIKLFTPTIQLNIIIPTSEQHCC